MSGTLRVLTYHRVVDPDAATHGSPTVVSATPAAFDRQMRHLARRYRVVSAEEVLDAVATGRPLPPRAVLVTFDDAYRDFGEVAWPILRRHRLSATLFVPTAYIDSPGRAFWWDRLYCALAASSRARLDATPVGPLQLGSAADVRVSVKRLQTYVKSRPHAEAMRAVDAVCAAAGGGDERGPGTLTWRELRELSRDGVALGAHTRTHPMLTAIPSGQVREEVRGAREDLQREIGRWLPVFAYPGGAHDASVVGILREEGYQVAFTTLPGHNRLPLEDPLRLARTNVGRRTSRLKFGLRLLPWMAPLDRWRQGHAAV